MILIGINEGVGVIYGFIIVLGIFVVLVLGIFFKIKKLFLFLVIGMVIIVIGLILILVVIEKMGGGNVIVVDFGDKINLLFVFVMIFFIVGV